VHALSPVSGGTSVERIDYFWKDPVKPATASDGNFISRTDTDGLGLPQPVDSFTVFLGVPIEPVANPFPASTPNDFVGSDGTARDIYDPQRRWFSEVIRTDGPMIELLARTGWSQAGSHTLGSIPPPAGYPAPGTATFSANVASAGALAAIIAAGGGRVRLAFRVKTNRGTDDSDYFSSAFTSRTRGAAIVDDVDVRINGGGSNAITGGDFEAPGSIDNTLLTVDGIIVTHGSAAVTSSGGFEAVNVGDHVYGNNVPAGTTVAAKADDSNITLSNAAVNGSSGARMWFTPVNAVEAWKATGKPPKVFVHVHTVDPAGGLNWADPCSPPDFSHPSAPNRTCNMVHNVLTGGDHDNGERPAGDFGSGSTNGNFNMRDTFKFGVSPVIITATDASNPTHYNAMGLNSDLMTSFTDWAVFCDIHTAGFRGTGGTGQGGARSFFVSSWPARQANGATVWGEARSTLGVFFNSTNTCNIQGFLLWTSGYVATSNVGGIPDSIRVYAQYMIRCYSNSIPISRCAGGTPMLATLTGQYMDNFSFTIFRGTPTPGLSQSPWMLYADAFPQYVSSMSPMTMRTDFSSAAFDTATAVMKSAINRALNAGLTRISVSGDTAQVTTGAAPALRVDLVFRVYPGPGNYVTIGTRTLPDGRIADLRKVPTSAQKTADEPAPLSGNFWEAYMADNGAFGTGGNGGAGPGHPRADGTMGVGTPGNPRVWDANVWNSARMDTLEQNLWPNTAGGQNIAQNSGGSDWRTSYHEEDPKFVSLGIARNRCFMVSPTGNQSCASKAPTATAQCNVICGTVPSAGSFVGTYPPTWTLAAGGGDGTEVSNGNPVFYGSWGPTSEGTKIIPDGQLTAGSLVQYFFRRDPGTAGPVDHYPDTTRIFSGSSDGSRWHSISVLPDRWKDAAFQSTGGGGTGMACMLVVDVADLGGDEFFWVSAADTIGLTAPAKRGANTGWYAAGGANTAGTFDQATFRSDNGGQPGTLWDLYNVRAGGSITTGAAWLSNRYAAQPLASQLTDRKQSTTGIFDGLLASSSVGYKSMVWLTGAVTSTFFGTVAERTDDDLGLLNRYALTPANGQRAILVWGSGFAENLAGVTGGTTWLNTFFGVTLRSSSYRTLSGHQSPVAHAWASPGGAFDLAGNRQGIDFGLSDGCGVENDVLNVYAPVGTAVASTYYENVGTQGPYVGSVVAPAGGSRQHTTLLDGSRIQRIGDYANVLPSGRQGYHYYVIKALTITAGAVACGPYASPIGVGDGPQVGAGSAFVNFLNLRSANPMRMGEALLAFGLARTEKVELKVYDVAGRLVKTVAHRVFAGGREHVAIWDGTDEAGHEVHGGVYFYRITTPSWTSQKKLTVLSR